jgi:hypothetical protein
MHSEAEINTFGFESACVYFHDATDPGSGTASNIRQRPVGSPARPRVTPT